MEIVRLFTIALLIAVTAVGIPYFAFVLVTAPMRRQSTIQLVVAQLAATVRQHIPLATGLAIAATSEPPRVRRRLRGMSRLIGKGRKLSDAMRSAFPECPGLLISLVDAGERSGQLPAAVQQVEQYVRDNSRFSGTRVETPLPYAIVILTSALFVTFVVMVVVVPKIKEIFRDFNVGAMHGAYNLIIVSKIMAIMLTVLVFMLPISLWIRIKPRKTPIPSTLSRAADWVRWHTPGLSKLEFGQGMSTAFSTMEFCVHSGMNLHEAVAIASRLDINWNLRQKLLRLSSELSHGTDVRDAAKTADVGGIAAIVLASGARQRNMTAALRFAADYYGSMISRWWAFLRNISWPICTLLLACMIGSLVFSLFQPLVLLIDATLLSTGL